MVTIGISEEAWGEDLEELSVCDDLPVLLFRFGPLVRRKASTEGCSVRDSHTEWRKNADTKSVLLWPLRSIKKICMRLRKSTTFAHFVDK